MTDNPLRSRTAQLLALPITLALLVLIGLALSSETQDEYEDRKEEEAREQQSGSGESSRGDQAGGSTQNGGEQNGRGENGRGENGSGEEQTVIQTEDGPVIISRDADGNPVIIRDGDQISAGNHFTPDEDGQYRGFQVTEDNQLEMLRIDDPYDADDFAVGYPSGDNRVRIVTPEGTTFDFEVNESELIVDQPASYETDADNDIALYDIPLNDGTNAGTNEGTTEGEPSNILYFGTGESGAVAVQVDADGTVEARWVEVETADAADVSGLVLTEDGKIEVVPLDEIDDNDTLLVPTRDGFDIELPDGSVVELRDNGDEIEATQINPDGSTVELPINPDGSVTLEDGRDVGPFDFEEVDEGFFEEIFNDATDMPWAYIFGGIALLVLISGSIAYYLYKHNNDEVAEIARLHAPEFFNQTDLFEEFLNKLLADEDQKRAIRVGFSAAERGLGNIPVKKKIETPFEWHERVARVNSPGAEPLERICDIYAKARFAPDETSREDVQLIVEKLRELHRLNISQGELVGA